MSFDRQTSDSPEVNQAENSQTVPALLSVAHSRIMHQTIELETLVVNLDSGVYYSLEELASVVWQLAITNQSADQIASTLKGKYGSIPKLETDISDFLTQLICEGLLKVCTELNCEKPSIPNIRDLTSGLRDQYKAPIFTRYVDLQDLLLADPIHELMDAT